MQKLNRNHLKLIACVTMLVDHIGWVMQVNGPALVIMRGIIGRIAFPIFSFLLVEGFFHTRNRLKYLLRIALLGVISEIPYDRLFRHRTFYWNNQNILFLLALGLIMFSVLSYIRQQAHLHIAAAVALQAVVIAGSASLAELLRFDYGAAGIAMLAVLFYFLRFEKKRESAPRWMADRLALPRAVLSGTIALNLAMFIESGTVTPGALLSAIPICFYTGKRGKLRLKYAFYLYYPVHLLALLLIFQ